MGPESPRYGWNNRSLVYLSAVAMYNNALQTSQIPVCVFSNEHVAIARTGFRWGLLLCEMKKRLINAYALFRVEHFRFETICSLKRARYNWQDTNFFFDSATVIDVTRRIIQNNTSCCVFMGKMLSIHRTDRKGLKTTTRFAIDRIMRVVHPLSIQYDDFVKFY